MGRGVYDLARSMLKTTHEGKAIIFVGCLGNSLLSLGGPLSPGVCPFVDDLFSCTRHYNNFSVIFFFFFSFNLSSIFKEERHQWMGVKVGNRDV